MCCLLHLCLALLVPLWTGPHGFCWAQVRNQCFPLDVQADGNCLFRSISLLLFGSERHHTELCCRTVLEMATNPQLFLDGKHWCGMHDAVTPEEIIQVASMTSVSSNPSLALAFHEEVMAVRKCCSLKGCLLVDGMFCPVSSPTLGLSPLLVTL